jgi:hypothetical protein
MHPLKYQPHTVCDRKFQLHLWHKKYGNDLRNKTWQKLYLAMGVLVLGHPPSSQSAHSSASTLGDISVQKRILMKTPRNNEPKKMPINRLFQAWHVVIKHQNLFYF